MNRGKRRARRGKKQAQKNSRGPKRRHDHPKKRAPARKSARKHASGPQPPEISPGILEKLGNTVKRVSFASDALYAEARNPFRDGAANHIALRDAAFSLSAPRLIPELVPGVQISLEMLEKKQSVLPEEAANALAVRSNSTIRRWARQGRLDRTVDGRIVVNEKFKLLYKQRHSPATGKK